jgi:hypothetical protein
VPAPSQPPATDSSTNSSTTTTAPNPTAAPDPTAAPPAPATTPVPSAPPGQPSPTGLNPGEASAADASPTSRLPAINVKLGRPAAGQGLEVRTVRPRFSVTTMLTSNPRRSTVDVVFGRDGRVLRAAFQQGRTTGYPEVDGPLLDAIYRWTARGRALADIPPDADVAKGLLVTFNIEL